MALCVVNDGIRKFPESLSYILADGFTDTLKQKKRYLNNRTAKQEQTVKLKVAVITDFDYSIFVQWFVSELDYGNLDFTIKLPVYGMLREWNVKTTSDLISTLQGRTMREIMLDLTILEDVETVIANGDYEMQTTCQ